MNLSGSGASWTIGPRGASIGIGRRGAYLNSGIPGTGIYSREKISGGSPVRRNYASSGTREVAIKVSINDDGVLSFTDSNGVPLSEALIEAARKQQGDKIKGLIQTKCDEINSQVEALGKIHVHTPPPVALGYAVEKYTEPSPFIPALKTPGFLCRIFKSLMEKVEAENNAILRAHQARVREWEIRKSNFEAVPVLRKELVGRVIAGEEAAMEQYLESVLKDIVWPRETLVSFEFGKNGSVAFDVDLPEIEEMPTKTATVPQRGLKLTVKEMGPTWTQKLYMNHVHAVGFRVVGEAFAALPTIQTVTLSAYSQRPNKATAQITDEYLYSVRIARKDWSNINFENLSQLDAVETFNSFEIRREMSKTGVFKAIKPFVG